MIDVRGGIVSARGSLNLRCASLAGFIAAAVSEAFRQLGHYVAPSLWGTIYDWCVDSACDFMPQPTVQLHRVDGPITLRLCRGRRVDYRILAGLSSSLRRMLVEAEGGTRMECYVVKLEPPAVYATFVRPCMINIHIIVDRKVARRR